MSKTIIFTAAKFVADNRVLEQDEKGYYKVTLGAINVFNSAGEFYLDDGVKDLIENQSGSLNRRLKSGYLKGETGHPELQVGMTKAQFFARNLRIDISNTSHHIRDLMLTPTNTPSGVPAKGNTILVEGWIKPSGPNGEALKKDLDNPDCNVAFSIRSFTNNETIGGITYKRLAQIVTWDWVLEPGISVANKFDRLSVESLDYCSFEYEELIEKGEISSCLNCSLESNDERDMVNELITIVNHSSKNMSIVTAW